MFRFVAQDFLLKVFIVNINHKYINFTESIRSSRFFEWQLRFHSLGFLNQHKHEILEGATFVSNRTSRLIILNFLNHHEHQIHSFYESIRRSLFCFES